MRVCSGVLRADLDPIHKQPVMSCSTVCAGVSTQPAVAYRNSCGGRGAVPTAPPPSIHHTSTRPAQPTCKPLLRHRSLQRIQSRPQRVLRLQRLALRLGGGSCPVVLPSYRLLLLRIQSLQIIHLQQRKGAGTRWREELVMRCDFREAKRSERQVHKGRNNTE